MPITCPTIVLLPVLVLSAGASDTDWPHLRGPGHDGRIASSVFETGAFALDLAWKTPLGSAYSGITIAEDTVVTMAVDDTIHGGGDGGGGGGGDGGGGGGGVDVLVAFDATNGEQRWQIPLGPKFRGQDGADDGPLSTPLIHREAAYALSPRGRLVAVSLAGGELLWSRDLVTELGSKKPEYGHATTPVGCDDLVIVQVGGTDGNSLVAFDAATGVVRWAEGDTEVEYGSPAVMDLAGRRQVVACRSTLITGHDPQTGMVLWTQELGRRDASGSAIASPLDENRFFVSLGGGLVVYEVTIADGSFAVAETLRTRELGSTYNPPVRFGNHFYGFKRDFLTCVDATTGTRVWKSRPPGGRGLLLVNDRLVIFGARGRIVVARATPDGYAEEASLEVFDGSGLTWPSFAGGRIFVRNPDLIAALSVVPRDAARLADAGDTEDADGEPRPRAGTRATPDGAFARFLKGLDDVADRRQAIEDHLATQDSIPIVERDLVHFVYRSDDDVAIASTMLDTSRPEPMQRVEGTDLHHRTFRVEPGSRIEYRFQVVLERWENDPLNPRVVPSAWGGREVSELAMPGYVRPGHVDEPATEARGRLEEITFRDPRIDDDRTITVYLPHAYDAEPRRRFPLLIVLDGADWREHGRFVNTLDNVCGNGTAPLVTAFIDPLDSWWLEAGGSQTAEFVDMLADALVPHLESRFRLEPRPTARATLGAADHGLAALFAAVSRPDVFGKAAGQSVGLRNGAQVELFELLRRRPPAAVELYLDWSLYELRGVDRSFDFGADARTLASAFDEAGYAFTGGEARDAHGWAGWRARTDRILATFFPAR